MNPAPTRITALAVPDDRRSRSATWGLASLALATASGSLGTSIVNVALPQLARQFDAPFAAAQWIVSAYLLAGTATIVIAGRLGDLFGSRRLLLVGLATFALASVAAAAAPNLALLVAARAVQGAAAAVLTALSLALARAAVSKARSGAAMGLIGTMSAVGTALGPSLGGALLESWGWRVVFLANVPLTLAALAGGARFLERDSRREAGAGLERLDLRGAVLLAIALASLALSTTLPRLAPGPWAALSLLAALVAAFAFVLAERRSAVPLVPLALLRTNGLWRALLSNGVVSAVVMATMVVGPFHLVRGLGLDASATGLVMAIGPLVSALVGFPAGKWVDSVGSRRVSSFGLAGLTLGAGLLAWLGSSGSAVAYAAPLALLTAGYALFQAANNTAVMADVAAERRGTVSGLLSLSRNLGLLLGTTALGSVFAAACGTGDVSSATPAAVVEAMRVTFGICALLVAIPFVLARTVRGERA